MLLRACCSRMDLHRIGAYSSHLHFFMYTRYYSPRLLTISEPSLPRRPPTPPPAPHSHQTHSASSTPQLSTQNHLQRSMHDNAVHTPMQDLPLSSPKLPRRWSSPPQHLASTRARSCDLACSVRGSCLQGSPALCVFSTYTVHTDLLLLEKCAPEAHREGACALCVHLALLDVIVSVHLVEAVLRDALVQAIGTRLVTQTSADSPLAVHPL